MVQDSTTKQINRTYIFWSRTQRLWVDSVVDGRRARLQQFITE